MHLDTLQHTAVRCNTLQRTLLHTATHCNTVHRTATHCPLVGGIPYGVQKLLSNKIISKNSRKLRVCNGHGSCNVNIEFDTLVKFAREPTRWFVPDWKRPRCQVERTRTKMIFLCSRMWRTLQHRNTATLYNRDRDALQHNRWFIRKTPLPRHGWGDDIFTQPHVGVAVTVYKWQCTATHCNTQQHSQATTHCNTLQHTANTLQHTATLLNTLRLQLSQTTTRCSCHGAAEKLWPQWANADVSRCLSLPPDSGVPAQDYLQSRAALASLWVGQHPESKRAREQLYEPRHYFQTDWH